MNNNQDSADVLSSSGKGFNFKLFTSKVLSNWIWIVLAAGLGLAAAYLYLRYATPLYQTTASIIIKQDEKSALGQNAILQEMGGGMSRTAAPKENEVFILKTRGLMVEVVKALDLHIKYFYQGNIRAIESLDPPFKVQVLSSLDSIFRPVAFHIQSKGNTFVLRDVNTESEMTVPAGLPFDLKGVGRIRIEKLPGGKFDKNFTFHISPVKSAAGEYGSKLSVNILSKDLDVINLGFKYPLPQKSERIISTLIREYIKSTVKDRNRIADSTVAFIEERLVYVSEELGDVEGNIQSFRQQNQLANFTEQSSTLITSTSQFTTELSVIENQLNILNALESYVSDPSHKRVVPGGALPENPGFAEIVARYNTLILEREKIALSQTPDNPVIKNLDAQISSLRGDMHANLQNTRKALLITRANLQKRINQVQGKMRSVPSKERNFLDLTRQQQIKQELYVFLLQKREETAISKTSNTSNCEVVEAPSSYGPISPQKMNILAYGFLFGLFIPLGVIFVMTAMNDKIVSKEDITRAVTVPIIGEIGNSREVQSIVVAKDSRSPISEQFRSLRTNLSFFLKEDEKVLLLTSSMSGEGKSFISLNLAAVLAFSGKKVVVMEMDLRKPNLSAKLNISNKTGFTNYIIDQKMMPWDIITPSGLDDNLFVIGSGPLPPNPTETILSKRTDELMSYLSDTFDYVIIDAPPIGLVTDAQLLSKYSDLALYLVRQRYTHRKQLEIPEDIYVEGKMKNIALLVNDIGKDYISGYGYGYGYGYGNYGERSK